MKSLVLLYRDDNHELVIKNYPQVKDNKEYYVIGKSWYGSNVGIKKSCMEQILTKNTYRYEYHMFLPDVIKDYYSNQTVFMFVNKTQYDKNPIYYQDMIMNYREE